MYVPPYESLLRALDTNKASVDKVGKVTMPLPLFQMLLQIAISSGEFDEDNYLRENSDIRDAVNRGSIESGFMHYIGYGYLEGRRGGAPIVDEDWYAKQYPDVAAAMKSGKVKSAADHFYSTGAGEGRCPNVDQQENATQWKTALNM